MKDNRAKADAAADAVAAEIRAGQSIELLKELHILTREGRLNQDSRRKLKQVYHLYQFIEKLLLELPQTPKPLPPGRPDNRCWPSGAVDVEVGDRGPTFRPLSPGHSDDDRSPAGGRDAGVGDDGSPLEGITIADHGAGKSYLGFILYDLFFKQRDSGTIYGIETRAELVEKSRELAARLGFDRMRFVNLSVADSAHSAELPNRVDMVTALHACDTATDDAIAFGLQKRAKFMVLVPCCQAEFARALSSSKALSLARTPLAELWRHPLHTREMGSQITNVLRCLYLEACGYQVSVTELVGWEHSLKNELIVARFTGHNKRSAAVRMCSILEEFGLSELLPARFPALDQQQRPSIPSAP